MPNVSTPLNDVRGSRPTLPIDHAVNCFAGLNSAGNSAVRLDDCCLDYLAGLKGKASVNHAAFLGQLSGLRDIDANQSAQRHVAVFGVLNSLVIKAGGVDRQEQIQRLLEDVKAGRDTALGRDGHGGGRAAERLRRELVEAFQKCAPVDRKKAGEYLAKTVADQNVAQLLDRQPAPTIQDLKTSYLFGNGSIDAMNLWQRGLLSEQGDNFSIFEHRLYKLLEQPFTKPVADSGTRGSVDTKGDDRAEYLGRGITVTVNPTFKNIGNSKGGDAGPPGPQGLVGEAGPQGPQGPAGLVSPIVLESPPGPVSPIVSPIVLESPPGPVSPIVSPIVLESPPGPVSPIVSPIVLESPPGPVSPIVSTIVLESSPDPEPAIVLERPQDKPNPTPPNATKKLDGKFRYEVIELPRIYSTHSTFQSTHHGSLASAQRTGTDPTGRDPSFIGEHEKVHATVSTKLYMYHNKVDTSLADANSDGTSQDSPASVKRSGHSNPQRQGSSVELNLVPTESA
ncbi:hypothetical protein [Pseudomonas typographi]|uniref:hypothetical protein n=1 Tax=Pseudomonas typographi TaxID=2715964 RepID=UPI0016868C2E|nr:hypothetical protein [Pseudomonas typographi]MBD1552396.1 hypothetical protein [Pseudomonas typographi]